MQIREFQGKITQIILKSLQMIQVFNSDCQKVLEQFESDFLDSMITDPPAGISFMGKDWDNSQDFIQRMTEIYKKCLRVLKPGAHGLVWAIPRTSHWTATALEQAGFEIRDVITHVFGSGFPKSMDVSKAIDKMLGAEREKLGRDPNQEGRKSKNNTGILAGQAQYENPPPQAEERIVYITAPSSPEAKQWEGWGTALKPASEHWILVRKPLGEKTVAKNVLKHGTGGLNIDASRIGTEATIRPLGKSMSGVNIGSEERNNGPSMHKMGGSESGRFPANFVLSHNEDCEAECTEGCAVAELDGQSLAAGIHFSGQSKSFVNPNKPTNLIQNGGVGNNNLRYIDASVGASRFFYCAKASKRDRGDGNIHPTVKSTKLMEYLIKLVTPPNGIVLDPFMGSGSTGVAAKKLGFRFIGIEKEQEYFEIAKKRLDI